MYFDIQHWKGNTYDMFLCNDISFKHIQEWAGEKAVVIPQAVFAEIPYWEVGQLLGGN